MVLSYYLYRRPYQLLWHLMHWFRKEPQLVLYCADPVDWEILSRLAKYLPHYSWVASGRNVRHYLDKRAVDYHQMPAFPDCVIMCRHQAHKFPVKRILKFGLRHGVYHFKKFTDPRHYRAFDRYFVTSQQEVDLARSMGIENTVAAGFPKLDGLYDGSYSGNDLKRLREECRLDPQKATIFFTATYEKSKMSALSLWKDRIHTLADRYNILVTLHPWISAAKRRMLAERPGVRLIDGYELNPYMLIADVMVGDTSSLLGEFCALNKPIVTFRVPESRRSLPEITRLLDEISTRVENFAELEQALEWISSRGDDKAAARAEANRLLFAYRDGNSARRIADYILRIWDSKFAGTDSLV